MKRQPLGAAPSFSVIIPAWNEATVIGEAIAGVRRALPGAEVIVADGGSEDFTGAIVSAMGVRVVRSERGRGIQCNAGAARATGEVLVFLHADTMLPEAARELLVTRLADQRVKIGTFRLRFDKRHWALNTCAAFTRYDSLFTRFGDQCIVVRRSFFDELGGFRDWPLFEDVDLLRRARRRTKIHSFPAAVTTSARRFRETGVVRTQLFNGWLLFKYLGGVSPFELVRARERKVVAGSPAQPAALGGDVASTDTPSAVLRKEMS